MTLASKTFDETDSEHSKDFSMVVIVDDDPEILEILESQLKKNNINYKIFLDPLEAMNFVSKNRVAHVYTDYHMKGYGMTGKWIKEICLEKKTDCSIVSCDSSVADILKDDFIKNILSYVG